MLDTAQAGAEDAGEQGRGAGGRGCRGAFHAGHCLAAKFDVTFRDQCISPGSSAPTRLIWSASSMSVAICGGIQNGSICGSNRVAWCRACQANVRDVPVVAVLVGLQASEKTTFCRDVLGERCVQVSKDRFPNARNCQQRQLLVREALAAGLDIVIDNMNPSSAEWQPLVETARNRGAGEVAYWFPPDLMGSLPRNAARAGRARVPETGVMSTVSGLRQPGRAAGSMAC